MNDSNNLPSDKGMQNSCRCLLPGRAFERDYVGNSTPYRPEREHVINPCRIQAKYNDHFYKGWIRITVPLTFLCKHILFAKTHRVQLPPLPHLFLGGLWLWLLFEMNRLFSAGGSRAHNRLLGCSPCVGHSPAKLILFRS